MRPAGERSRGTHVVVALTGASGAVYGVRLLEALECEKSAIVSEEALRILRLETGLGARELRRRSTRLYRNSELDAPIASGSRPFDGMVICPCSMSTASKIACGISDNLVTRAASVALKERRRLVLVPRETPLSTIHLRALTTLSEAGAVVLPAGPACYGRPASVGELVDFVVGRVLDALGVENRLYRRWGE
ncbi:MAG: UbiX family flavin prenyltransferase [Thermoplasmata archaeon]